ncbi:MAG: sigma-70 family RNA polymerase sigma factor [Lentisphaerota bacterium]
MKKAIARLCAEPCKRVEKQVGLTRTAQKYKDELKALADNLPFKRIMLPEFEKASYQPEQVRQQRTFHTTDSHSQAIGRFLVERGTVELLTPKQTMDLFKELHWNCEQIRKLARKRFTDTTAWRGAVVEARRSISRIEAAEEELFIANRRLVVSCIKPYFWIGQVWLADFLQEGSKALSNAIRKFDFARGTPFYVYSQKAIQNRLRNYFRDHIRSGNIGIRPTREMLMIKEILDNWALDHKDPPAIAVLAKLTSIPELRVQKILPFIRQWETLPAPFVSLDAEMNSSGENNATLYEFIEDADAEEASQAVQRSEIWAAIDRLPPRAKYIMRLRFIEGRTLEETGQILSLTRARIKQIQDDSLRKLRQMLRRGVKNPKM